MKKAIIIGSGIAGIATSIRLKSKGYKVTVFEASETIGGKIGEIRKEGYRWDKGPSLFTMPHLVDELFDLFNLNAREYFNYKKKQTVCNYFWDNGSKFSAKQDVDEFIKDATKEFDVNPEQLKRYLDNSLKKYQITAPIFIEKSLHKIGTYLTKNTLLGLLNIFSLDLNKKLNDVHESLFQDDRLVQLFNRFATYNGSSPYKTPGIMSMIPSLEMYYGTYFPTKGMRSIVDSLFELAEKGGVNFRVNEKVEKIIYDSNKTKGIETNLGYYDADVIVSNMDAYYTYKKLLPSLKSPQKSINQERSSSGIIFYWGVKKEFPELDLHNIFFSSNYKEEFSNLFDKKEIYEDPTIYINISSKDKSDDAPEGSENWFVMVNAPSNNGQDWDEIRGQTKKNVIKKLSAILNFDIASVIETEEYLDPILIDKNTFSYQGSLYGTSSNSKYSAFLRHPNSSRDFDNLYFCGGSVHPGGGIPLCLNSAKITADLIP